MASVLIVKLNGWPETFDERAEAIASSVDDLVLIRPKPLQPTDRLSESTNITVYDLRPRRGSFVSPGWSKPVVFPVHVLQAILLIAYLFCRGRLPPVIHALDYALGGLAGAAGGRLFSVPFVVSVRGLKEPRYRAFAEEEQTVRARISYYILRLMTRFVLASADHILTKAEYQVEFVRDTFGVDPGFTTVPTGVDFELFDPAEVVGTEGSGLSELFDAGIRDDDDVVLYLGKLTPEKGPQKVVQHLRAEDDWFPLGVRFAFVGEFRSEAFERRFKELRKGLSCRTLLHASRVPFKSVPKLLNQADAVVLLAEGGSEGVPRVLQESCAMQTPIIASDVTGISSAFRGLPGCYLVDRESAEEFRAAVNRALVQPPDMPRELFADRFDMHRNYAKYASVYETLSAGNGSP